jgi:hypothetical protein
MWLPSYNTIIKAGVCKLFTGRTQSVTNKPITIFIDNAGLLSYYKGKGIELHETRKSILISKDKFYRIF